jgi:UDP-N-acetylmuramate--alanine ligase
VRDILPLVTCPVTSYGLSEDAEVRAVDVRAVGTQMHFTVQRRNGVTLPDLQVVLNLAGEHNVLNALAVIAVAAELNVPDEALLRALAGFTGVGRRFQRLQLDHLTNWVSRELHPVENMPDYGGWVPTGRALSQRPPPRCT